MAKKKGHKRAAVKHVAKRVRHHAKSAMSTRPGKILMAAGIAAAGGVVTSLAVNHTPKVKDMSQTSKALLQGGAGLLAVFFAPKAWMKALGGGAVLASAFGVSKSVLKLDPLAGPSAGAPTLPPDMMRRLAQGTGMGLPAKVSMRGMGLPARVRMNGPVIPSRSGGWGGVSF